MQDCSWLCIAADGQAARGQRDLGKVVFNTVYYKNTKMVREDARMD